MIIFKTKPYENQTVYPVVGMSFYCICAATTCHNCKVVPDEYFGQKIDDSHRYIENMDDPIVMKWFKGQGDYSHSVLDHISGRDELVQKFIELGARQTTVIYNLNITENDKLAK